MIRRFESFAAKVVFAIADKDAPLFSAFQHAPALDDKLLMTPAAINLARVSSREPPFAIRAAFENLGPGRVTFRLRLKPAAFRTGKAGNYFPGPVFLKL